MKKRVVAFTLVALLSLGMSLHASDFNEPGLYIIHHQPKGCSIQKWDSTYSQQRQLSTIVTDDFFIKRMGGCSQSSNYRQLDTKQRSDKALRSESQETTMEEVENILESLRHPNESGLYSALLLSALMGYNTRPELSTKCLKILLADLSKIGDNSMTKTELISAIKHYFHQEGLGSNAYIPQEIKDSFFDQKLRKYGKGVKLYTVLEESEAAVFKKALQKFFQ